MFSDSFAGLKERCCCCSRQTALYFTVEGPVWGGGDPPVGPSTPPRPIYRPVAGLKGCGARPPAPGDSWAQLGRRAAGRARAGKTPSAAAHGARASALGWCASAAAPRPLGARSRLLGSPPPARGGRGGSSSLPSPERPRQRRRVLNERRRLLRSRSAVLGGGSGA